MTSHEIAPFYDRGTRSASGARTDAFSLSLYFPRSRGYEWLPVTRAHTLRTARRVIVPRHERVVAGWGAAVAATAAGSEFRGSSVSERRKKTDRNIPRRTRLVPKETVFDYETYARYRTSSLFSQITPAPPRLLSPVSAFVHAFAPLFGSIPRLLPSLVSLGYISFCCYHFIRSQGAQVNGLG